jgi:acyl-CoA dehydrogenase
MTTRAVQDGEDWVINGRKIWVSGVAPRRLRHRHGPHRRGKRQEGVTAFIVERGTRASSSSARSR